jgi:cytochrome c6
MSFWSVGFEALALSCLFFVGGQWNQVQGFAMVDVSRSRIVATSCGHVTWTALHQSCTIHEEEEAHETVVLDTTSTHACNSMSPMVDSTKANPMWPWFWNLTPAELVFGMGMMLLLATMTPLRVAAIDGNVQQGHVLFDANCASCHRGGLNAMNPSKTLLEADLVQNLGNSQPETVQGFFSNSFVHKMMAFPTVPGGKLSETNVVDVTAFISDQAKGNKW